MRLDVPSAQLVSDGWHIWVGPGPDPRTGQRLHAVALANPWADEGRTGLLMFLRLLKADAGLTGRVVALLAGKRVGASCYGHGRALVCVANGEDWSTTQAQALEALAGTRELFQ